MQAPEMVETPRLLLRRPRREDAEAIFARYASDGQVTRLVGWARHRSLKDTHAFLDDSDALWERWPGGPYLVESRENGALLGGTGFTFETPRRAMTGYVLARDAWGWGFATEALRAVVEVARGIGVVRLYALCHPDNPASWRVLDKCGFTREGLLRKHIDYPNLAPGGPGDAFCYAIILE